MTFIRRAENLEYVEAVKYLAERAGMQLPEDVAEDKTARLRLRILEMNRERPVFPQLPCLPGRRRGLEYLLVRGLDKRMITRFGLGYAPDSWNALRDHLQQKGFSWEEMEAAAW